MFYVQRVPNAFFPKPLRSSFKKKKEEKERKRKENNLVR